MTPAPVYWGNHKWNIENNGQLVQGEPLREDDPNWIDYTKVSGRHTNEFCNDAHPHRELRLRLREQIRREVLEGCAKFKETPPFCILTHGGVASGKTSAVEMLLKENPSVKDRYLHIDFDRMKRQLPEFIFMHSRGIKEAAEYTQTESGTIAATVFKKAITAGLNVIYEGSLAETKTISERIRQMRIKGYEITLLSTYVNEKTGQERARQRFRQGGRYIPPEVIERTYRLCPTTLVELVRLVDYFTLINNEIVESAGRIILIIDNQKIVHFDSQLYTDYIQAVGSAGDLQISQLGTER